MQNTWLIHIIVFILFPILFFHKASFQHERAQGEILSKTDTNMLRGFAAISIMFAHYVVYGIKEANPFGGPVIVMQWAGGLGVCLFFFCSGYGLMQTSANHKVDFGFLKQRFIKILPTYWVLNIFFALLRGDMGNGILSVFLTILGLRSPAWFIVEILLIYILYFIVFQINPKYPVLGMTVMLIIMSAVFFALNFEARWYNANFVFIIGMLCSKYKEKIITWLYHKYCLKLFGSVFLFGMLALVFIVIRGTIAGDLMKILGGGILCILFLQLVMKIKLNSPFIIYIGKNSLQLYLIHTNIWSVFSPYLPGVNIQIKFIICMTASVLCIGLYNSCKYVIQNSRIKYKNSRNE